MKLVLPLELYGVDAAFWALHYSCTGKLPALFPHREQKCPSRLSPAERLDDPVWTDLCDLLAHPEHGSAIPRS